MAAAETPPAPPRRARGFLRASGLLDAELRAAARRLGFAETRLLTHWTDLAGPEIAAIARPVKMRRGPGGGTLTLAVEGARAPELQMRLPALRARLAAAFGPQAVTRISLTQPAAAGFAEPPAPFAPAPPAAPPETLRPALATVADAELRAALETLAGNVVSRGRHRRKPGS